ncbi:MAG TPA: Gfo/Idh/MocA family oxidoreductase [Planctomycetota bacterium]|nr:Gfo/Idh/MocA family oxidoreductase [Planctomycetota bacterium]
MREARAGGRSRRQFLRGVAAAAGGLAAAPHFLTSTALGGEGRAAASERVVTGYIAVGPRGLQNAREQMSCSDAQVVAVCDVWKHVRERAKAIVDMGYAGKDCATYVDFRDILARDDIDAVGVASPDHWHVPMAVMAMKAGKDVHVEKPLGVSLVEDIACRETARRLGRVVQYGTEARSMGNCRLGCELIRSGRLGQIKEIRVKAPNSARGGNTKPMPVPEGLDYDLWLGPAPWRPYTGCPTGGGSWYHCYDYALGFIAGWGAHPLDLLVWAYDLHTLGPWEIEGTGVVPSEGRHDAVIDWNCKLRLSNGVEMTYQAWGVTPETEPKLARLGNYTQFIGTEGWLAVYYGGMCCEPDSLRSAPLGPNDVHLKESWGHEADFIRCVRTREAPVSPIDDAVRSDTVSHVCDLAIRLGRPLKWDPLKEEFLGDPDAARLTRRVLREPWRL